MLWDLFRVNTQVIQAKIWLQFAAHHTSTLAARGLAGSVGGRGGMNRTATSGDASKSKMHRTVTGSRVNLADLENVIQSAAVANNTDVETSSVSSTRSGGGRSNIIQVSSHPMHLPLAFSMKHFAFEESRWQWLVCKACVNFGRLPYWSSLGLLEHKYTGTSPELRSSSTMSGSVSVANSIVWSGSSNDSSSSCG